MSAEGKRLQESADADKSWRKWGAYVSEQHKTTMKQNEGKRQKHHAHAQHANA